MIRVAVTYAALAGAVYALQPSPIVHGQAVTFIAPGDRSDPPRIVADFNGWEGGAMTPSADGGTYTLTVTLDPSARIEYLLAYRDRFMRDPGNPLSVPAPAGPPRSELRMPQYRQPPPLQAAQRHGRVDDVAFSGRTGDRRRIRVYTPATARDNLPVLYVHDGDIVLGALGLPATLDSLIEAGEMAPAIVAFVDAVDRHDDYEPGSPFRQVFVTEIVPFVENRYRVARNRRSLLGLSRSAVGALDTCSNGGIRFDACALVAPAIPEKAFPVVLPAAGSGTRLFVDTGTYDIPLVDDARVLGRELERRGLRVRYRELPQGHNHTAFRAMLPELMRLLFPVA